MEEEIRRAQDNCLLLEESKKALQLKCTSLKTFVSESMGKCFFVSLLSETIIFRSCAGREQADKARIALLEKNNREGKHAISAQGNVKLASVTSPEESKEILIVRQKYADF